MRMGRKFRKAKKLKNVIDTTKDTEQAVYLSITTWVGTFGIHYYGSLYYNGKREEICWIPPEKQRKMLNDLEEKMFRLKKGQSTRQFLSESDLIKEAKKQWKEIFPSAKFLLIDWPGILGVKILDSKGTK